MSRTLAGPQLFITASCAVWQYACTGTARHTSCCVSSHVPAMSSRAPPLITVSRLKETLKSKPANVQVLDVSWHLPTFNRDAPAEFAEKHIPTAQFLQTEAYNNKLPTPEQFGEDVGKLGVGNDTHVVVYDNNPTFGMFSAPRAWWLLRYYGHENVSILDGGFPKWEEAGYETTDVVDKVEPKTFKANPNAALLRTMEDIDANFKKKRFTLVDGRPAASFLGRVSVRGMHPLRRFASNQESPDSYPTKSYRLTRLSVYFRVSFS